jgi:DNA-binding FrmR family transcriptional regulator
MPQGRFDKTLIRRMIWIHGQSGGILRMMHNNRPFNEVLTQLYAVMGALQKLIYPHFDTGLRSDLLSRLIAFSSAKDLSPEIAVSLAQIRKRLASCTTKEILGLYYEFNLLESASSGKPQPKNRMIQPVLGLSKKGEKTSYRHSER